MVGLDQDSQVVKVDMTSLLDQNLKCRFISSKSMKIFQITMRESYEGPLLKRVTMTKTRLCELSVQRVHEWWSSDLGERMTKH